MKVLALATLCTAIALPAMAQDYAAQLKARQGQFRILAINLGIIGDMAKGEAPYDAEAAQASADSIVAVSMINQGPLWPAGSSEMDIDGTRAKAEMWDNLDDVMSKWQALGTQAANLQQVAATGQEALGPALGTLGGTCKSCHDEYRVPAN